MPKFIAYNDPSHGWLKVNRDLLEELNLLDKISSCSYQRGMSVYLEEDCDATLFCNAMQERGTPVSIKNQYSNKSSKIRSYDSYKPGTVYVQTTHKRA